MALHYAAVEMFARTDTFTDLNIQLGDLNEVLSNSEE